METAALLIEMRRVAEARGDADVLAALDVTDGLQAEVLRLSRKLAGTSEGRAARFVSEHIRREELERLILGAILINNGALDLVAKRLKPGSFATVLHRQIFAVATEVIRSGRPATPITLRSLLGNAGIVDEPTSRYLVRLAAEAPCLADVEDFADELVLLSQG